MHLLGKEKHVGSNPSMGSNLLNKLINTVMPEIKINLSKWYHYIMELAPLVAMIATGLMWIDTRYMHRQISDTRFIELQIKIIDGHLNEYNRILDSGGTLTAAEQTKYEMNKHQLQNLTEERNKILGIGSLPQ